CARLRLRRYFDYW
nr:immunoglobulin heavy chain junction region [Mus musculus]